MDNNFDLGKRLSTGNKIIDLAGGILSGLNASSNRPVNYYVNSNWKGNGIADSKIGYLQNNRYYNPYDQAQMLSALLGKDGNSFSLKLKGLFGNKDEEDYNRWTNRGDLEYNYNLPVQGYKMPESLGYLGDNQAGQPVINNGKYDYSFIKDGYSKPYWLQ